MLQLSNLELTDFVDAEIQQNPLLDGASATAEEAPPAGDAADGRRSNRRRRPCPKTLVRTISLPMRPSIGTPQRGPKATARSISAASRRPGAAATARSAATTARGFEQTAARPRTLREHVLEQIGTDLGGPGRPADRPAPARSARRNRLSARRARRRGAAARLRPGAGRGGAGRGSSNSIPAGVFARDLPECLALQLRDRNRLDPAMQALLDHLPLLAARNIAGADAGVPGRCRGRGRDDRARSNRSTRARASPSIRRWRSRSCPTS